MAGLELTILAYVKVYWQMKNASKDFVAGLELTILVQVLVLWPMKTYYIAESTNNGKNTANDVVRIVK